MTHCTQCGNQFATNDRFCGQCGHAREGSASQRREQTPAREMRPSKREAPVFKPAMSTEEGRAAYDALVAKKAASTSTVRLTALGIAVCLGGITAIFWDTRPAAYLCIATGIATAIAVLFAVVSDLSAWSESDYYSMPGSHDDSGEHRCIHCGHRGIYRHGQYKSSTKFVDCSKCKVNLWRE